MESKTYAVIGGKLAKVPMEYADKLIKKEMLVARAAALQKFCEEQSEINSVEARIACNTAHFELSQLMGKIIRLNRQIPPVVQFV